ncbi:MAG: molybdopterin-dependent oxidoreductase [Deltaproteobacteria bacterium]|nr:molybdopterin-dependent oxidoreductase [Deltaproteobacteria bacterium]
MVAFKGDKSGDSRRSFLKWLGVGSVIALSECTRDENSSMDAGFDMTDSVNTDVTDAKEFPFVEGSGDDDIFRLWGERTIDPQNIKRILNNWNLTVDGMVARSGVFKFSEIVDMERVNQVMDFHCVEGWSIWDVPWNGVHMNRIFSIVQPEKQAKFVTFHTIDGKYNESVPMEIATEPHTILAYGVNNSTLPLKHGFPLRLVIPRLLAYKSAKYINRIELTDHPVNGFWVERGYPYDAPVPESRLRDGKY